MLTDTPNDPEELRAAILDLVGRYHAAAHARPPFNPDKPNIPVSGRVYGARDMQLLVDSALDFWLTTGRFNAEFEQKLARRIGVKHALTVNSGSSANLVAFMALTSPRLKARQLRPGDEVITCATGFPTTINPILQANMVPVFVDADIPTYNINVAAIEEAITPRTRAIMIAHTLGNPFDVASVRAICDRHGLFLIEDCCDALGATVGGQHVGTFGDIGTLSFYPAHHITMGEGGAVFTNDSNLDKIMESFRDWGRDCYCGSGQDNTCNKRFNWKLGDLPKGYDHKYIYSHLGYNLKITDMQAAVGVAQLEHLDDFIAAPTQFRSASRRPRSSRRYLRVAGGHGRLRSFLVRIRPHAAQGRAHRSSWPAARTPGQEYRDAAAVWRQSRASALHEGPQFPRFGNARQRGRDRRQNILDWRLPRIGRARNRLHDRDANQLLPRRPQDRRMTAFMEPERRPRASVRRASLVL